MVNGTMSASGQSKVSFTLIGTSMSIAILLLTTMDDVLCVILIALDLFSRMRDNSLIVKEETNMSKRAGKDIAKRVVRRQNKNSDALRDSMRAPRRNYGGGKAK